MGRWLPQRGWPGRDGLSGDLNGLTRPRRPLRSHPGAHARQTEECRGVGSAPAFPDDAGVPTALRIYHLGAAIQSPDPLIDFRGPPTGLQRRWDSVTRPLDRLPLNTTPADLLLGFSHQTP